MMKNEDEKTKEEKMNKEKIETIKNWLNASNFSPFAGVHAYVENLKRRTTNSAIIVIINRSV